MKRDSSVIAVLSKLKPVSAHPDPNYVFCGQVRYLMPNGWKVDVRMDCCKWDYVEEVTLEDGQRLKSPWAADTPMSVDLYNWKPNNMSDWFIKEVCEKYAR